MKKQKIAICDQDVEYTRQLVNYIAAKEKDSFEVTGFSDESLYRKNDENFDLLLYEETFFQNKEEAGRAKKAICLSNGEISTEQENMRVLFKYQPADRILREIHAGIGKVAGSMDTSIVSVPADPTVGVGREMEEKSEPGTQDIPLDIYERQLQINKNRMEVKENDD